MTVEESVHGFVAAFGCEKVEGCPEAAAAVALARELDDVGVSATAKAACARSLADLLERIRGLAPADDEGDRLNELAARRARRAGGGAAS